MPKAFRLPSNSLPPTPPAVGTSVLKEVVEGLLSGDAATQHATIARFFHPVATYTGHFVKIEGRWQIFRALRAGHTLFAIRPQVVEVYPDRDGLKGLVVVNQLFKPRVPLVGGLLPELVCPCLMEFSFERTPDGMGVLITDFKNHVDLSYLPNLLGPPGVWVYRQFMLPLNGWALSRLEDTLEFGQALTTFAAKQLCVGKAAAQAAVGH